MVIAKRLDVICGIQRTAARPSTRSGNFASVSRGNQNEAKNTGWQRKKSKKAWKDPDGAIYDWDSRHGTVEKYNSRGRHEGEFDPDTGKRLKPANPARKVEP